MPAPDSLGAQGERFVERFLESQGYAIIARNWRSRYGEIDLIGRHENSLVFIEVKTRRSFKYGEGVESVDARKQAKLRSLAEQYLYETDQQEAECRFDVAILELIGSQYQLELIKAAF